MPLSAQHWLCSGPIFTLTCQPGCSGAGQKAKYKLSSSLVFGVCDQNCLTCAFLHSIRESADIVEWQDCPWEGCGAFCWVGVCDTAAAMS